MGVTRYQAGGLQGQGGAEDARLVADLLMRSAGVPPDHARVLVDGEATAAGIKLAFQRLQKAVESGRDTVFLYLGGAAILEPGTSHYRFLPSDADAAGLVETTISGTELSAWIGALRAQWVLAFVDTPHAGAVALPRKPDPGRRAGLFASTSAASSTASARLPVGSGIYAQALASALQGTADANRDRLVTLDELRLFLPSAIGVRTGGSQTPETHAGFGGGLPEIVLPVLNPPG